MVTSYKTISNPSKGIYKEKGSKFIDYAYPNSNEAEFKAHLALLKKEYNDARHHCYAFRLGSEMTDYRYSDDGEPNNSAGKPIFGQIQSFELTNIAIIVVRYFGGTKLGVGGLVSAYKEAAKDAINNAEIIEKKVAEIYLLTFQYDRMNTVMNFIKRNQFEVIHQDFNLECSIQIKITLNKKPAFLEQVQNFENINYSFLKLA